MVEEDPAASVGVRAVDVGLVLDRESEIGSAVESRSMTASTSDDGIRVECKICSVGRS